MSSSRLARTVNGHLVAVTTAGRVLHVLGNDLPVAEARIGWLGERTGRINSVTAPRRTNADPLPRDPA